MVVGRNLEMSKRIVVTGGAGFIGSAFVRHLIARTSAAVLVIDKLSYASNLAALAEAASNPRYRFVKTDICDAELVQHTLRDFRPDAVVHLAAESHVDRSIDNPSVFIQNNIVGTFALVQSVLRYRDTLTFDAARGFRFVHVSTDEVFGSLRGSERFDEATSYDPSSPYSASKAASDHLVNAWHRTYGLPAVIVNCSNNYGPWQFPEKLISLMTVNGILGKEMPIYGNGMNVRDWLYVDDSARALQAAVEHGRTGHRYCIGGKEPRTNIEVVGLICRLLDELSPKPFTHAGLIRHVEDRPGHDLRYEVNPSKAEHELKWVPGESMETGLRKTVAWFLANRSVWERLRQEIYRGQRLGRAVAR